MSKDVFFQKGAVYYYIIKKRINGMLVLDYNSLIDSYLIGISQPLGYHKRIPVLEDIMSCSVYTIAWFDKSSTLPPFRLHFLGTVDIKGDYTKKSGLLIRSDGNVIISNFGQKETWKHEFCAFGLPGRTMSELVNADNLPLSIINLENY